MNTKINKILLLILLVAAILRLWKLGSIPPHLTPDETALGYNAYSILKTGRDEYGESLPIIFKSFGDFKPGLYVYLTVPFIATFGLNEWSVRFPSALSGILAVWLLYLITSKLKNENLLEIGNRKLEILAPALLAISPWHIHFSRGAWEANVSLTLTLLGLYYFLKSLKDTKFLIPSSLLFSLTFLTYQGAKLSTSLVVFVLVAAFWKEIRDWFVTKRRSLVEFGIAIIVGLVIVSPILVSLIQGKAGRLEVFSIFSYPRKLTDIQNILNQGDEKFGGLSYYLFHSESLNFARGILGRWFNHFSGRFLFFEGDYQNPRHSAPNHGMFLLFDIVLLPCGFVVLLKSNKRKIRWLILLWMILSPLPAILSRDQVHAVRSLNMVVPITLISSFGLIGVLRWVRGAKNSLLSTTYWMLIIFLFGASLIYFLDAYFVHLPRHNSKYWEYGYKQIVETIRPIQKNYKEIKVQQSFAQPYIYFLFYGLETNSQGYDPAKYQRQAKLVESEYKGDVGYVERLDNICFCAIDFPQDKKDHGTLVVADTIRIPDKELDSDSVNLIKEIKYLNGEIAFRIVEIK